MAKPDMGESDEQVRVLRALGHPLRYAIVRLLADPTQPADDPCALCGIVCASRLRLRFGVSAPDLTHHMNQLEGAGLVDVHRDGVWVRYELHRQGIARFCSELAALQDTSTNAADAPDSRPPHPV